MKTIKILGISILLLILVMGIISFFMPSKIEIEKSIVIKAMPEVVFEQVNDLHNWEKWSPWIEADTTMDIKYFGNEKGEGAGFEWKSENPRIGNGIITVLSSVLNDSILCEIEFLKKDKATATFYFNKVEAGTRVNWSIKMNIGVNPLKRLMRALIIKRISNDSEKGLRNLKRNIESTRIIDQALVETTQFPGFRFEGIRATAKPQEIRQKMSFFLSELREYIKTNNLKVIGSPFSIFFSFTVDKIDFLTGIPTEDTGKDSKTIISGKIDSCKVATLDYYGPYSGIEKGYSVINKWIDDNKKKGSGEPFEIYITNRENEKDSTKWLTRIFFPIER
jgi:effector-binding domain-containing protein